MIHLTENQELLVSCDEVRVRHHAGMKVKRRGRSGDTLTCIGMRNPHCLGFIGHVDKSLQVGRAETIVRLYKSLSTIVDEWKIGSDGIYSTCGGYLIRWCE